MRSGDIFVCYFVACQGWSSQSVHAVTLLELIHAIQTENVVYRRMIFVIVPARPYADTSLFKILPRKTDAGIGLSGSRIIRIRDVEKALAKGQEA